MKYSPKKKYGTGGTRANHKITESTQIINSMTQTTVTSLFVCMDYDSRGVFHKSNLSVKAAKIHVNRHSPICKAAGLGYRELRVESRRSDAMAGRSPWQADVQHEPHPVSGISHLFAVKTN